MFAQWISEESNAAADIEKRETGYGHIRENPAYSASSSNKSEYSKN